MSRVHFALAQFLKAHGSDAVLSALRDACGNAQDFTIACGAESDLVSAAWGRAYASMNDALNHVHVAEYQGDSVDLESSLLVLDDTDESNEDEVDIDDRCGARLLDGREECVLSYGHDGRHVDGSGSSWDPVRDIMAKHDAFVEALKGDK